MNNRDSEVVKGLLLVRGYKLVDSAEKTDVVLFNTCPLSQREEDRVWSALSKIKPSDPRTEPIVGIIGCMVQTYKEKIFKRASQVDFVVGPAKFV